MKLKNILSLILIASAFTGAEAALTEEQQLARRNVERAMAVMDATWAKGAVQRSKTDLYMRDMIDNAAASTSGSSDVWPYTAAIEAHCSLLEAFDALLTLNDSETTAFVNENREKFAERLDLLIDNLEWYRGSYYLSSYATTSKEVTPYAVPRAGSRGTANVTGILNVYDDQMWLSRELIRAYRLTAKRKYLNRAVYLTDYVLEGWDCWHDENGKEYGGITWGPGYNSKHACSNAPIIQPLVWLSDIYKELEANDMLTAEEKAYKFYDRDADNKVYVVKDNTVPRSQRYLEFARKVYDWQKEKLYNKDSKVFWDMMGADHGDIIVEKGYRQHVNNGGPVGNFYPYNTGTMIAGAAELFRTTGDEVLLSDLDDYIDGSIRQFGQESYRKNTYVFDTDPSATSGFLTWFNDVLIRGLVDAIPYAKSEGAKPIKYLGKHQENLDYAFENFNVGNLLPIDLRNGWKNETKTKPFHQFAFASEYALFATELLSRFGEDSSIDQVVAADVTPDGIVYSLAGVRLGRYTEIKNALRPGIYLVNNKKILVN